MKLSEMQRKFTHGIGKLIMFAYSEGYELTTGDGYRDPRLHGEFGEKKGYGAAFSVHKVRLAQDLNLWVNGEYIQSSEHPAWAVLHEYWEKECGGAPAVPKDANHFSYEYQGKR